MQDLEILNSKEKKKIIKKIQEQWDCETDILKQLVLYRTNNGRIFASNMETAELESTIIIRKYSIGNYIGSETPHGFRVSIEGSQLFGPTCKKNIITLEDKQIIEWIKGKDLEFDSECKGFCIIKNNQGDFVGCGNYKNNKLFNYIPKARRLSNI